jgi:GNAT superfamily N-acetyltransferase
MLVRHTTVDDWEILKEIRLAALLDAPTAFGVSYANAVTYSDAQWRERAAADSQPEFLLAFIDDAAVGIIGHAVSAAAQCKLIAMWVRPGFRGTPVAAALVEAVKARALAQGHARLVLEVSPANARAAAFYLRQGFSFLPAWEMLASHPEIELQKMEWRH